MELTVSPEDTKNTGDLTITFTLGNEYNGREARVWYHVDSLPASVDGTVTDGNLTVTVKNLETFMITLKQAANGENGTDSNNNENASGDNGNVSGNNTNGSQKKSKGNVKTGDSALALRVSSIVLLTLSAICMLLFKKKREARHFN